MKTRTATTQKAGHWRLDFPMEHYLTLHQVQYMPAEDGEFVVNLNMNIIHILQAKFISNCQIFDSAEVEITTLGTQRYAHFKKNGIFFVGNIPGKISSLFGLSHILAEIAKKSREPGDKTYKELVTLAIEHYNITDGTVKKYLQDELSKDAYKEAFVKFKTEGSEFSLRNIWASYVDLKTQIAELLSPEHEDGFRFLFHKDQISQSSMLPGIYVVDNHLLFQYPPERTDFGLKGIRLVELQASAAEEVKKLLPESFSEIITSAFKFIIIDPTLAKQDLIKLASLVKRGREKVAALRERDKIITDSNIKLLSQFMVELRKYIGRDNVVQINTKEVTYPDLSDFGEALGSKGTIETSEIEVRRFNKLFSFLAELRLATIKFAYARHGAKKEKVSLRISTHLRSKRFESDFARLIEALSKSQHRLLLNPKSPATATREEPTTNLATPFTEKDFLPRTDPGSKKSGKTDAQRERIKRKKLRAKLKKKEDAEAKELAAKEEKELALQAKAQRAEENREARLAAAQRREEAKLAAKAKRREERRLRKQPPAATKDEGGAGLFEDQTHTQDAPKGRAELFEDKTSVAIEMPDPLEKAKAQFHSSLRDSYRKIHTNLGINFEPSSERSSLAVNDVSEDSISVTFFGIEDDKILIAFPQSDLGTTIQYNKEKQELNLLTRFNGDKIAAYDVARQFIENNLINAPIVVATKVVIAETGGTGSGPLVIASDRVRTTTRSHPSLRLKPPLHPLLLTTSPPMPDNASHKASEPSLPHRHKPYPPRPTARPRKPPLPPRPKATIGDAFKVIDPAMHFDFTMSQCLEQRVLDGKFIPEKLMPSLPEELRDYLISLDSDPRVIEPSVHGSYLYKDPGDIDFQVVVEPGFTKGTDLEIKERLKSQLPTQLMESGLVEIGLRKIGRHEGFHEGFVVGTVKVGKYAEFTFIEKLDHERNQNWISTTDALCFSPLAPKERQLHYKPSFVSRITRNGTWPFPRDVPFIPNIHTRDWPLRLIYSHMHKGADLEGKVSYLAHDMADYYEHRTAENNQHIARAQKQIDLKLADEIKAIKPNPRRKEEVPKGEETPKTEEALKEEKALRKEEILEKEEALREEYGKIYARLNPKNVVQILNKQINFFFKHKKLSEEDRQKFDTSLIKIYEDLLTRYPATQEVAELLNEKIKTLREKAPRIVEVAEEFPVLSKGPKTSKPKTPGSKVKTPILTTKKDPKEKARD